MKTFQEACVNLESLQTFDPAAFEGNEEVPQDLCNFVLALALIYNDCKNITYAATLLKECRPPGPEKTGVWGTYAGTDRHLFRLMVSAVHELFNLIRDHENVLSHEFFVSRVVQSLSPASRKSWVSLTGAATGATPKDEFGRMLLRIRNKIAFHYEPKEIFRGFKRTFLGPTRLQEQAYISRGQSMAASRFYFADAAVDGYFLEMVGEGEIKQLSAKIHDVTESLNRALLGLVDRFIQQRGFPYRNV